MATQQSLAASVFIHGAAGDVNPLAGQSLCDVLIAHRVVRILVGENLFDHLLHAQCWLEEEIETDYFSGVNLNIFAVCGTTDGAFVKAQIFGELGAGERHEEAQFAGGDESGLSLGEVAGDEGELLSSGFESIEERLCAFDEFHDMATLVLGGGTFAVQINVAAFVLPVNADVERRRPVHFDDPTKRIEGDTDIGLRADALASAQNDSVGRKPFSGERAETRDDIESLIDEGLLGLEFALDGADVALNEFIPTTFEDGSGELLRIGLWALKLEREAVAQVERADARGFALAEKTDDEFRFFEGGVAIESGFFGRGDEVAALVDTGNDVEADALQIGGQLRQELTAKVIPKAVVTGGQVEPIGGGLVIWKASLELSAFGRGAKLLRRDVFEYLFAADWLELFVNLGQSGILLEFDTDGLLEFEAVQLQDLALEHQTRVNALL